MYKVLHVMKDLNSGGIQSFVKNLSMGLEDKGIQFDIVCHWTKSTGLWEDFFTTYGAQIYKFRTMIECNGTIKYRRQWERFWETYGAQYEIVHMHYMSHEGLIAEVAKKYGKTVIAHSHATVEHKITFERLVKRYVNRRLNQNSDFLLACSKVAGTDFFGDEFEKRGIVVKNSIYVDLYDFNPVEREKKRKELGIEGQLVVGHVGNYVYPKNQDFMIRVFGEFSKIYPDAILIWAGMVSETDRKHLEVIMNQYDIKEKVILLGRYADIGNLLQAMDIFLFPSLYEGLAIALIEAQTAGLPCVISDIIPEEVEVTDLLTRVPLKKSPQEWADVLASQLNYIRRGRKKDVQDMGYGIASLADHMEQIYLEAGYKKIVDTGG